MGKTPEVTPKAPARNNPQQRVGYISRTFALLVRSIAFLLLLAGPAFATCTNPVSANPSSINFGNVGLGVGLFGAHGLQLINSCNVNLTIDSLTFDPPVFGLADGVLPRYLNANSTDNWSMAFRPKAAQTYTGTLTIALSGGYPSVVVNLTGTGVDNQGLPTLSTSFINFGNVPVGTTVAKNVSLTNNGTAAFTLTELNTYAPFQVTPLANPTSINPGKTFRFTISCTATGVGVVKGNVNLVYNLLTPQGIDVTANGTAPAGVAFTSFPVLPAATQGSAYLTTLHATGGKPPYTFHITKGSATIPGLTFTCSSGTFGGLVSSTVPVGNYTLIIQVNDSNQPPQAATTTFTLPVGPPTGANCNIVESYVPGTSTPLTALNDLGTGTYLGYEGGLYPNGSNTDPNPHASDGVAIGRGIQPRDADGNIDPTNGSVVFMSLGVSNTQQPFNDFMNIANGDPAKNPRVAIVNGALGGETAVGLAYSTYLSTVVDYVLPFYGYTANQVAAVWLDTVDSDAGSFPGDATTLQSELETIVAALKVDFPNLVLVYHGAANYTGYAQGVSTILPEPQAYESAFGDQWAIADQINGVCCNYNPANGTVVAPWMGWGYYYWANGLLARQDGTVLVQREMESRRFR